jgi:transposase InsO family protein/transposase-like protein
MYSTEQRRLALETYIRLGHSYADTFSELGYPSDFTLREWWRTYVNTGEVPLPKAELEPRFSVREKCHAVSYYLDHARCVSTTLRDLGYPGSHKLLCRWIDELAPGLRRRYKKGSADPLASHADGQPRGTRPLPERRAADDRRTDGHDGASFPSRARDTMGTGAGGGPNSTGEAMSRRPDELPDDVFELQKMIFDLKSQVRKLELERDVLEGTREILKKDPGTDPVRLGNPDKARLIGSLRSKWSLAELLAATKMAKSSYEYAVCAQKRPETRDPRDVRERVAASFAQSGHTYGYRRVLGDVNQGAETHIGEWTIRRTMRSMGLVAKMARTRRAYSSYKGEISRAPENTCLRKDGTHDFSAASPNVLWVTDITEFAIPAGKVYLSAVLDCFDGMPVGWSVSSSPDAEMANASLRQACLQLADGEHPRAHSDRGCHYRWPGWIGICEARGLVRSMSRKATSPDNARAEGFFGRLKVEFFYGRDWRGASVRDFSEMLGSYLTWYRDVRIKSDLGYVSPRSYRLSLGLSV